MNTEHILNKLMKDMEEMRLENERLRNKVETLETHSIAPEVVPSKVDVGESHRSDDLPEFEAKGDTFGAKGDTFGQSLV
jgi:hypothetical protein